MGFFGMSQTGKDARNNIRDMAGWNRTQANDWTSRAGEMWGKSSGGYDWAKDYWQGRAANGYAAPSTIRDTGKEILPIDETIRRINENQARRDAAAAAAAGGGTAAKEQIDYGTGHLGEQVQGTYSDTQAAIDTGFQGINDLADKSFGDVSGNIDESFGTARGDWNAALKELRQRNAADRQTQIDVGDDMARRSMGYLDEWSKDIESLKPGGEFAAARAARAFAPSMAAVGGRLRRAGVDPNSVQAASLIGGVEADRGRAMDDAFAEGQETYVNARGQLVGAKTGLLGDYRDYSSGVIRDALGNEINLGGAQAQGNTDLTLGQGGAKNDALNAQANTKINNQAARASQTAAATQQSFENTSGVTGMSNASALEKFGVDQTVLDNVNNLMANADKVTLTEVDLSRLQYGMGDDWNKMDQQTRDNAVQAFGMLNSEQMRAAFSSGQMAAQYGQEAADLYNKIFMTESANAGWGLKGLMGLAGTLLAGPIGGAIGTAIGGAIGGARTGGNPVPAGTRGGG